MPAAPTYTVRVGQRGNLKSAVASSTDSVAFTVSNEGNQTGVTYTLSRGVTGSITSSGTIPSSVVLDAGKVSTIYGKFVAQGAGTVGQMWLVAQRQSGSERDSGYVATAVPGTPTPRMYSRSDPKAASVIHYHEGTQKTVSTFSLMNGGDTSVKVVLVPSSQNTAVVTTPKVRRLPSGGQLTVDTIILAAGAKQDYELLATTAGGGATNVRVAMSEGTFADTAFFRDSVTTASPSVSIVGDSVLDEPVYEPGGSTVKNWFSATNGASPADWQVSTVETNVTPILTNLQGSRTVHFEPGETKILSSSATLPSAAGLTQLCTRIQGYAIATKTICGEVRSRPANRVVSITNSLGKTDTLAAETTGRLEGSIVLSVGDAQDIIDNPYSLLNFLRARSKDDAVFKVTRIDALNTGSTCPYATWSADSIIFDFRGTSTPGNYTPCLTRSFAVYGTRGSGGGPVQLDVTAGHHDDYGNRRWLSAAPTVAVLPKLLASITGGTPAMQYVPQSTRGTIDFTVGTRREYTWTLTASASSSFRRDSIVWLDRQSTVWRNPDPSQPGSPSVSLVMGRFESRNFRLYFTPTASGNTTFTITVSGTSPAVGGSVTPQVTSAATTAVSADLSLTPTDQLQRARCVITSAGPGAAWQCGDLLVAHGTVPYVSRNETHGLTLLYHSNSAAPRGAVVAKVTVPAGQSPTTIRAIVRVGADTLNFSAPDTMFYNGADWWAGAPRYVAPRLNLAGKATGRYLWQLDLAPITGGVVGSTSSFRGMVMVVNNVLNTTVAPGWQLAGMDRIYWAGSPPTDSSVLIVEGDGTAKLFAKTVAGWQAPRGDFSQLRLDATGTFVRRYKNGIEKWYRVDSTVMVRAIDPVGVAARYYWSKPGTSSLTWRVDSIVDEAGVRSRLYYGGSGLLDSIRSPDRPGGKLLRIFRDASSRISQITDPDNNGATFQYAANGLLTSRTGRRLGEYVTFDYDSAYTVTAAHGPDALRFQSLRGGAFADGKVVGTSGAPAPTLADPALAIANARGDTARILVDALGQPTEIRPPVGSKTVIYRNPLTTLPDSIFQNLRKGLPDSVSMTVRTLEYYTPAFGDLDSTKTKWLVRAEAVGQSQVYVYDSVITRYEYDSAFHHVKRIVQPDGLDVRIFYTGAYRDSLLVAGIRMAWFEYVGRDEQDSSAWIAAKKGIQTTPSARGMLKSIWERGHSYPFELQYGLFGNLVAELTPEQHARALGEQMSYLYDSTGLYTVGSVGPAGDSTTYGFDALRRVVRRTLVARATKPPILAPGTTWQERIVRKDSTVYNDAASVVTSLTPSPTGGLYTSKSYSDGAGRVTKYCPYSGSTDGSVCDLNTYEFGMLAKEVLRNGATRTYQRDALGRVVSEYLTPPTTGNSPDPRAILYDTVTFEYGDQGVLVAHNRAAIVQRTYQGPFLRSEVLSINDLNGTGSAWGGQYRHSMMTRYTYDQMGRVVKREFGDPKSATVSACPPDMICTTPERDFGLSGSDTLKFVTTFAYDSLGRIDSLHWGGGGRRSDINGSYVLVARGFRFSYDAAGRWTGLTNTVAAGGTASPSTLSIGYDDDDQVMAQAWTGLTNLALYDTLAKVGDPTWQRDAVGRPRFRRTHEGDFRLWYDGVGQLALNGNEYFSYDAYGAGQMQKSQFQGTLTYNTLGQLSQSLKGGSTVTNTYDLAGNRIREDDSINGTGTDIFSAYDGNNMLASRRDLPTGGSDSVTVVSAYWYDPLGRRVLASDSNSTKSGRVTRYFYSAAGPDAGEVLLEQQNIQTMPDWLTPSVRSIMSTARLPGPMGPNHVLLTFPDEDVVHEHFQHQDRQFTVLAESRSTGQGLAGYAQFKSFGQKTGGGSSAGGYTGGTEGSGGLVFLRNRYYDPNTGSFTQEDPIGLAGGMNAYGFASGDPISFSDPFGLKVCFQGDPDQRAKLKSAAERATNTSIQTDDAGCVTGFARGTGEGYGDLQDAFADMVGDSATFSVKLGNDKDGVSSFDPRTKTATINPLDIGRKRYISGGFFACIVGGSGTAPFSMASIVAHELIGHGSGMAGGGKPSPSGIWAENQYHAAVGEPRRCSESK